MCNYICMNGFVFFLTLNNNLKVFAQGAQKA